MGRNVTVKFRGEDVDVEIDEDGGYESDTNAHVIEWHFVGKTHQEYDALNVTDEEEQAIFEQLVEASYEIDEPDYL